MGASTASVQFEEFIDSLIETRLVARNGNKLELTTVECGCMMLPDGRYIAAENNTGRLMRWVNRFMEQRKNETAQ